MTPFTRLTATACPVGEANIDTDQLIPARFMHRSRAEGYGQVLLYDLRYGADGRSLDFPLDRLERAGAQIIVARRNFGCGSSREAAVYALADFGIRCVVAPSFGDIFAANAVNNGLLPARVSEEDGEALLSALEGGVHKMTVDLHDQVIEAQGISAQFFIDPIWRSKLLNGWDDIDLTMSRMADIQAFAQRIRLERPWSLPASHKPAPPLST